ncbi:tRNA U-34 5-methylaminomethyl-2-thiouridine biosynthesis protein [Candidatus Francisella endociliophora]|uniref:tRNA U-34 5-methylaminomethyl-2-thiouridine biosynthesis protein n=1 Tax=Candidatus Francisella endociliophora TaxID=653937 RepID=A0A097ER71_9GAMM|nr:tRNA (5-methylaminomethyl-2-thiouridine)(34)-methyltransferase MnmD [Francisella sp. FSC1006]AIT10071.1 tRNA U-34 5-methylaminomethyl-2-thiouridine biosynthesis protein [Francisella sp. FSC1006]
MKFTKLIWENDTPKSLFFDDFYFSSDAAVTESSYNFLEHNFLATKFRELGKSNQKFTIFESGFGAGLNFILTMNLWRKYVSNILNTTHLEFISFEKYPIRHSDLLKISQKFSNLVSYKDLLRVYCPIQGENNYQFEKIKLRLIIDDINNMSSYELPKIDAWFLDGFAPAKNSAMWNENLFTNMKLLSKKGSSFATFTASSLVRKALQRNDFEVKKDTGFGKKREMMYGSFIG